MSLSEEKRFKLLVLKDFLQEQASSKTAPFHDEAILLRTRLDMHDEEEQYRIAEEWIREKQKAIREFLRRLGGGE